MTHRRSENEPSSIGGPILNIAEFLKSLVAKKPDDAAALQQAIARLEAEKSTAQAELVKFAQRRPDLLLSDNDKAIDEDERASERSYRTVEKIDLVLPDLKTRLAAAKSVERRERWAELKGRFDASLSEFGVTFRRALEAHEELARIRNEAQLGGFAEEARSLIAAPHILSRDLLRQFEDEQTRHRTIAASRPKAVGPQTAGNFNPSLTHFDGSRKPNYFDEVLRKAAEQSNAGGAR
jgi:hypothetical protein